MTVACGPHQCRKSTGRMIGILARCEGRDVSFAIGIRSGLEQCVNDFGMTFSGGPHQCRLLLEFIRRIHVDTALSSMRTAGNTAGSRRGHQWCFAFRMRAFRIGAAFEKNLHHRDVAGAARLKQRRDSVIVRNFDFCARRKKGFHHIHIRVVCTPTAKASSHHSRSR